MKKWEYRTCYGKDLPELGGYGWEAYAVVLLYSGEINYYLKRELP